MSTGCARNGVVFGYTFGERGYELLRFDVGILVGGQDRSGYPHCSDLGVVDRDRVGLRVMLDTFHPPTSQCPAGGRTALRRRRCPLDRKHGQYHRPRSVAPAVVCDHPDQDVNAGTKIPVP